MSLFLDVEVSGGTSIEEAAQDAIDLANRIDITVLFRFNGVRCMACPGDDPVEQALGEQPDARDRAWADAGEGRADRAGEEKRRVAPVPQPLLRV